MKPFIVCSQWAWHFLDDCIIAKYPWFVILRKTLVAVFPLGTGSTESLPVRHISQIHIVLPTMETVRWKKCQYFKTLHNVVIEGKTSTENRHPGCNTSLDIYHGYKCSHTVEQTLFHWKCTWNDLNQIWGVMQVNNPYTTVCLNTWFGLAGRCASKPY